MVDNLIIVPDQKPMIEVIMTFTQSGINESRTVTLRFHNVADMNEALNDSFEVLITGKPIIIMGHPLCGLKITRLNLDAIKVHQINPNGEKNETPGISK